LLLWKRLREAAAVMHYLLGWDWSVADGHSGRLITDPAASSSDAVGGHHP
jgi:hypothetical protein